MHFQVRVKSLDTSILSRDSDEATEKSWRSSSTASTCVPATKSALNTIVERDATIRLPDRLSVTKAIGSAGIADFEDACENDDVKFIRHIISSPPSNPKGKKDKTVKIKASYYLCIAVQKSTDILDVLLDMGWARYVNEPALDTSSALDVAIQFDKEQAVSALLKHNATMYRDQFRTARCFHTSSHQILAQLTAHWAKSKDSYPARVDSLDAICWRRRLQKIMQLLDAGSRPSTGRLTWSEGFFDFLEHYLDFSTNIDFDDHTPLVFAILKDDVHSLKALCLWEIDLCCQDHHGRSLIHYAVKHNSFSALEFLLGCDVPIDAVDHYGRQPIHEAVIWNRVDITTKLVKAGANITCRDKSGVTPVHYAARLKTVDIIRRFMNLDIDLCCENSIGGRPIHYAAANNNVRTMSLLISKGAFLLEEDHRGYTPAHLAVLSGALDVLYFIGEDASIRENGFIHELLLFAKKEKKPMAFALIGAMIRAREHNMWIQCGQSPLARIKDIFQVEMSDEDL